MLGKLRFLLMLKKRIMENIVIDINFAHFRLNSFSHPLFQTFPSIVSFLPNSVNASVFYKLW